MAYNHVLFVHAIWQQRLDRVGARCSHRFQQAMAVAMTAYTDIKCAHILDMRGGAPPARWRPEFAECYT